MLTALSGLGNTTSMNTDTADLLADLLPFISALNIFLFVERVEAIDNVYGT